MHKDYTKSIMSYLDLLPSELQDRILGFPATTIQTICRGKITRVKQSLLRAKGLMVQKSQGHAIDTTSLRTFSIIKYCRKHAHIGVDEQFWRCFIREIDNDLWLNYYTGGPGAFWHTCIELEVPLLEMRLGFLPPFSHDNSDW